MQTKAIIAAAVFVSLGTSATQAADVDYVRDIKPIFAKHCYSCHGPKEQKQSLRVDSRAILLRGGGSGLAAITPGDLADSELIKRITDSDPAHRMPYKKPALPKATIELIKDWVKSGAPMPGDDAPLAETKTDHWSFQKVEAVEPPAVRNAQWSRNAIDRFVFARLEQEDLAPAPEADRVAWLRRVYFDLMGLPPTPLQIAAFIEDTQAGAYERVVDELLASPRYGERWAQHWLDVVRYADTHGFEVNTERPHAWPYRDYVIAAYNRDTPGDQFIREQIAGDTHGRDAATGFLVTASVLLPGQIGKDAASIRLARQDSIDEMVVNIGQSFLGLSIGCARCHNHMFDPISLKDYYSMQAFVAGVRYGDRPMRGATTVAQATKLKQLRDQLAMVTRDLTRLTPAAGSGAKRPRINSRANFDRFAPVKTKRIRFTINNTNLYEPCIDEFEVFDTNGRNVALASHGTVPTASGENVSANRHELRFVNDGEYGNERSWMCNTIKGGWVELEFKEPHEIERVTWGRDRQGKFSDRTAIDYRIEAQAEDGTWRTVSDSTDRVAFTEPVEANVSAAPKPDDAAATKRLNEQMMALQTKLDAANAKRVVFAGTFTKPDKIHMLRRGDPEQPMKPVSPAIPEVFGDLKLPNDMPEHERRRALAEWIASPDNPLTARVMVNRIWQGHFGVGLVDTPNDFGRNGTMPSHPELLDWLAGEYVRAGWSTKHMHRLIVLSATYRQVGAHNPTAAKIDGDARLLWRFPLRRLHGETLRDTMLAVSGRLDLTMGGRGFDLFDKRGGLTGFNPKQTFVKDGLRRMIYAHRVRREPDAVFGAFDCPDYGQSVGRRRESTTPIQALNLFNSQVTLNTSEAFAARVINDVGKGDDASAQIRRAYALALGRAPVESELSEAIPVVQQHGLATLCRVLFNSNEFVYLP